MIVDERRRDGVLRLQRRRLLLLNGD